MTTASTTGARISYEDLQARPVFSIRFANAGSLVPSPCSDPEESNPFGLEHLTRVGSDALLPLLCSGKGRVQPSKYVHHGVQALVNGRFRFFPELSFPFPQPLPYVPAWKMRAERGLAIFSGKHTINSFAGTCALMGLHLPSRWRGKSDFSPEDGVLSGMFLDIDISPIEDVPDELLRYGFRVSDDEQNEMTFKLPLCTDLQVEKSQEGERRRERRTGAERKFFPVPPPEVILEGLRFARRMKKIVSVGMTSLRLSGVSWEARKIGRHSDLATLRSCPEFPAADELGLLIDKREFLSIAGVVVAFALGEEDGR